MRRTSTELRRAAATVGVVLLTACASRQAKGDTVDPLGLIPPPPTIAVADAEAYEGDLVTLDTRIASARVESGQAVLVPESNSSNGLEVVVAPPLIGPSAAELVKKFEGADVRAIGRVTNLGGRLELLIGDPNRVSIVGEEAGVQVASRSGPDAVAPLPAAPAATSPSSATSRPAVVAAPSAPSAPSRSTAPIAPATSAAAVAQASTDAQACQSAQDAWRKAAAATKEPLAQLENCLTRGDPPCSREVSNLRVALGEVAASEERLHWVCPATR